MFGDPGGLSVLKLGESVLHEEPGELAAVLEKL